MTRHGFVRRLLAVALAAILVAHGTSIRAADDSSIRERHPNPITPTPSPDVDPSAGDGTGISDELPTPTLQVDPTTPPIVPLEAATSGEDSETASNANVRPKPTPRSFDNPASKPKAGSADEPGTGEATPTGDGEAPPAIPRLDDPVLRWLPEIIAAANATGVPPELIAGVMRLESDGNPNIISPDGARGLMQIMPDLLLGQGIAEDSWHDPATNIMAGASVLLNRVGAYGTWEGAVGAYFGFGCDVFGTCTDIYVAVVLGWAAYYAPIIADPLHFGFAILPADWLPPPIVPFFEAAPIPIEEPPPPPTPVVKTATPAPTPSATTAPTESPTDAAGSPTSEPTDEPTDVPTEEPTDVPTEVPTEIPTEEPTDVPTEEPTEVPAEEGSPNTGA
jgi:Transglycosylase SLT domain